MSCAVVAQADVFNMGGTRDPMTGTWTGSASVEFVPVGDPGNAADATGCGSVPYTYQMGKYDVTVGQYCEFLNAVAKTDTVGLYNSNMGSTNGLYGSHINIRQSGAPGNYSYTVGGSYAQAANCPIYAVSWGDAARFCNWLQNGQPSFSAGTPGEVSGSTESGAYSLNGATDNNSLILVTRNSGASYVLPTLDEWYKAAYYNVDKTASGYWSYPTQNDSCPCNCQAGTNNANYYSCGGGTTCTDPVNRLTTVGYFGGSPGPYGTYDQGGDINQWNETTLDEETFDARGGDRDPYCTAMVASPFGSGARADDRGQPDGVRVASVPEPGSITLLGMGAIGLLAYAWRWRRRS